jgi:hypothetical protein
VRELAIIEGGDMARAKRFALFTFVFLLLAAFTSTARLYNLDTGEVLAADYENNGLGRGSITVKTPSGKVLVGEYATISGMGYSTGMGTATAGGTGGYAWAVAQGFSFNQPGQQYGSATVAGDGLVIDIIYVVDPWTGNGHGVGKDNQGHHYRVHL